MEKIEVFISLTEIQSYYKGNIVKCTTDSNATPTGVVKVRLSVDEFIFVGWYTHGVANIRKATRKERRELRRSFI